MGKEKQTLRWIYLILILLILVLFTGCCGGNVMPKPVGIPLHGIEMFVSGPPPPYAPIGLNGYDPNGSFNVSFWILLGAIVGWGYDPVTGVLTFSAIIDIPCTLKRLQLYEGAGGEELWNYREKNTFQITPAPPGLQLYNFSVYIGDLLVTPAAIIYMVLVDGPGGEIVAGITPKVTSGFITPV